MASIEVNGVLADRLEKLITGQYGTLWLNTGTFPTMTFSLGYPFSGGLTGHDLVAHTTGQQAVTGTFYFSTLIEFGASDMYPLTIRDFSLDAAELLTLVSREPGRMSVIYHGEAFVAALNAKAWTITGSDNADGIAPSLFLNLGRADSISGMAGNDTLGGGSDSLSGGQDADLLSGNAAADRLLAGSGADTLMGGTGADWLDGGDGKDRLTGGDGADVFRFAIGNGADRITDFQDGIDHLKLAGSYSLVDKIGGTLIHHGTGTIVLDGIAAAQLHADDFI